MSYVACLSNALSPPMHPTKKELFFIPYSLFPYSLYPIPHPSSPLSIPHSLFLISYSYFIYYLSTRTISYNHLGSVFNSILHLFFFTTINTFSNFIPTSNNSFFISYFVFHICLFIHSSVRPCVCSSVHSFVRSLISSFVCFLFFSFIVSFTCSVVSS